MRAYSGEWNTFVTHKRCKLRKQVNRLLVKRMTVGEALKVRRLLGLALIPGFDPIADISCIVCVSCTARHTISQFLLATGLHPVGTCSKPETKEAPHIRFGPSKPWQEMNFKLMANFFLSLGCQGWQGSVFLSRRE